MGTLLTRPQLRELVDAKRFAPSIGKAAVLGSPIEHSLSPVLHEAAYRSLGLDGWSFDRWQVGGANDPSLADALMRALSDEAREAVPWRGFACTMPLKESALAAADVVSELAAELGAANTLVRLERGWAADNTDVIGLVNALREAGVSQVHRAMLLGAGATARAALVALRLLGARDITFAVRGEVRPTTTELASRYGMTVRSVRLADGQDVAAAMAEVPVTVATLPTGTALDLPAEGTNTLNGSVLVDVVYGHWPTDLATWAQARGARVQSGLPMLLHQAVEQVRLMTGRDPDVETMRGALRAHTDIES